MKTGYITRSFEPVCLVLCSDAAQALSMALYAEEKQGIDRAVNAGYNESVKRSCRTGGTPRAEFENKVMADWRKTGAANSTNGSQMAVKTSGKTAESLVL